jgi:uncharacterized membrane protein YoaK (UPF0700 family)
MSNVPEDVLSRERRDSLVLLLAWTAGSVDAIGYLGLNHVFTANMTGNTVLLGLTLGQGHGFAAIPNVLALLGFGMGVALGAAIVESGGKPGEWNRRVTGAIFLEGIMLTAFTVLWHAAPGGAARSSAVLYLLIALSALAMGIQSAAVRRLNLPGVATTYVTGTITTLIAGLTSHMRSAPPKAAERDAGREPTPGKHPVALQAGVFVTYGLSAVLSGLFQMRVPWLVAVTPLFAVALVLLIVSLSHRQQPPSRQNASV